MNSIIKQRVLPAVFVFGLLIVILFIVFRDHNCRIPNANDVVKIEVRDVSNPSPICSPLIIHDKGSIEQVLELLHTSTPAGDITLKKGGFLKIDFYSKDNVRTQFMLEHSANDQEILRHNDCFWSVKGVTEFFRLLCDKRSNGLQSR